MFKLAVTSAFVAAAQAQTLPVSGGGQRQGYVHSIDGVPTIPHFAVARWADKVQSRQVFTTNPTGRIVPRTLSANGASGGDDLVFNVAGTNLADHSLDGVSVTTNPARFELRVCVHHNSRNPFGLYSVTPELPCTCESPIIGDWTSLRTQVIAQQTCVVSAANPNGVCTYTGLSGAVESTSTDPTTGTLTFASAAVDSLMSKSSPLTDPRVPLDGVNPGTIPDGYELDAILCGFTEPRRHLYDAYHPNDGLASVRVPYTQDGSPSGQTNGGGAAAPFLPTAVGDVMSTYLVKFRRQCASNQECIDRSNDADSDNGADRRANLDRLRATLSTTCSASLSVCQVPEIEKRCGRNLYDFRSQKCCSETEADGKIVYPRGVSSFRSVNDAIDANYHDDVDLGELLLDVGAVEEFPCPCTADDGVDDLADFSGNTFDLGASIGCEKANQKCCTFRQLLDVYQTQAPNVVGSAGVAATRRAIEINPDLGMLSGPTALTSATTFLDSADASFQNMNAANNEDGIVGGVFGVQTELAVAGVNTAFNRPPLPAGATEAANWGPDIVGKTRAAEQFTVAVPFASAEYPQGSTLFPYYFCYDANVQQCCDDGQVYNPQSHQCCPIGNVVPIEQPCVCSTDAHCVRPELDSTDAAYASRKCCMQTSPPSEALEESIAFCNRYASVPLRVDEMYITTEQAGRMTQARFASGVASFASWRYSGRGLEVNNFQTPAEFRFDIDPADSNVKNGNNNQFDQQNNAGGEYELTYGAPRSNGDNRNGGGINSYGAPDFLTTQTGNLNDPVVDGYDRVVMKCPGTCIDPSYQLCCNGATCRGEYERCCNTTCCNKFSATCVKGKKPADEGLNRFGSLSAFQSQDVAFPLWKHSDGGATNSRSIFAIVNDWIDVGGGTVNNIFPLFTQYGDQQASGFNPFWSNRNYQLEYDVCTSVEYLDPVRAIWVFVLPTFMLLTSVTGLFATITFLLRIRTGYSPRYTCGETTLVSVAFLELVFALFLFFSPQWKYGLVVVLTALYAMFAVGIRSKYAYSVMIVAQLVLVMYLIDPFGGNRFFNLNEQRDVTYAREDANGLTWYASQGFNANTNGLWRAISANWPALDHRDTPNLFGRAPGQKTVDDAPEAFFGGVANQPGYGPGYKSSYCTRYYNYFQLDARLLDFKVDNPAEAFFGYCSRTWTVVLLVMSGFVILFALVLLALAVLGGVQQMLEDQDVSLVSDPEHFVDAQKVDSELQPYFAQQELAE